MWESLFSGIRQTIYNKIDGTGTIQFRNDEELMLFQKYLELWKKNWWTYTVKQIKWKYIPLDSLAPYSAYENVERVYVHIQWIEGCVGTAVREWDTSSYWRKWNFRNYIFDILDNEEAVKYIFSIALDYQSKIDAIAKQEQDAIDEAERIEKENMEEHARIEKYIQRINQLSWSTNELAEEFKLLREIESIGKLNADLVISWKENINKIYKLRQDFYSITQK